VKGTNLPALLLCALAAQATTLPAAQTNAALQLRVAAVQLRSTRDLAANLARITNAIHDCAGRGARVVAFPEGALSGFFADALTNLSAAQLAEAAQQIGAACRQAGLYALVGTAWREGSNLLNSALIFAPSGRLLERYDKIQLAEDWPVAGHRLFTFPVDGIPCAVILCHDERYPELVRLPVLAGARVVFCLSHESGLRKEHKLGPYRAQIQARAVENNVFVVQANAPANPDASGSHGQSRIVGPDGNLRCEATMFGEDVLTATLDVAEATRANALKSLTRGPLRDWWQEGLRRVRVIE